MRWAKGKGLWKLNSLEDARAMNQEKVFRGQKRLRDRKGRTTARLQMRGVRSQSAIKETLGRQLWLRIRQLWLRAEVKMEERAGLVERSKQGRALGTEISGSSFQMRKRRETCV